MSTMPDGFEDWSTDAQLAYKLGRGKVAEGEVVDDLAARLGLTLTPEQLRASARGWHAIATLVEQGASDDELGIVARATVLLDQYDFTYVALSKEAIDVLCALVHPDDVNSAGIFSDAWEELRRTFPIERFKARAMADGADFYNEDAGT